MKVVTIVSEISKLYIKDVAKITGVSEQLIRKWEKRYQIVQPERLDNGYRVYSANDVNTLVELKKLRDQNVSMKDAVQTILEKKISETIKKESAKVPESPFVQELIDSGTIYDAETIIHHLKQAHHQYGLALFLQNTVRPFLEKIGDLWEAETWDESQESISSLAVRDYLTEVDRHFQIKDDAPHVLGFCLPGELHDIPLQILMLQMKVAGWRTTRIAASPKFSSIEKLVKSLQPEKVLLSASTLIPFQKTESLIKDLDLIAKRYPNIDFYIGGRGAWEYTQIIKPKYIKVRFDVNDLIDR